VTLTGRPNTGTSAASHELADQQRAPRPPGQSTRSSRKYNKPTPSARTLATAKS